MVSFSIEAEAEINLGADLKNRLQPGNLLPIYRAWANHIEAESVRAFKSESAPYGGGSWQALNADYEKRKKASKKPKAKAGGRRKLQFAGSLYDSFYASASTEGVVAGSNLRVGSYSLGAIHQFGAPRRNIPARPILPIDSQGEPLQELTDELVEIAADYLQSL